MSYSSRLKELQLNRYMEHKKEGDVYIRDTFVTNYKLHRDEIRIGIVQNVSVTKTLVDEDNIYREYTSPIDNLGISIEKINWDSMDRERIVLPNDTEFLVWLHKNLSDWIFRYITEKK